MSAALVNWLGLVPLGMSPVLTMPLMTLIASASLNGAGASNSISFEIVDAVEHLADERREDRREFALAVERQVAVVGGADLPSGVAVGDDLGDAADLVPQPVGDPLHDFLGVFGVLVLVVLDQFPVGGEVEQPVLSPARSVATGVQKRMRGSPTFLASSVTLSPQGRLLMKTAKSWSVSAAVDRREGLALAGDVEQVTHVDPALDRPAMPLDLDILLLGGGDATEDRLRAAGQVHRQERGLDLPAVQTEKLVPGISLLDFAVLGVAAGLLEQFLDIDAAAFGREDEVLADLLDLGNFLRQFVEQDFVVVEVVLDVGLLALVVVRPLHDGVHDLFDREAVRLHLGDVVQEQRLQDLLAARGVDLEPPLGRLPDDASARLVGFVLVVELGTDGGDARRRAGGSSS